MAFLQLLKMRKMTGTPKNEVYFLQIKLNTQMCIMCNLITFDLFDLLTLIEILLDVSKASCER